MKTLTIRYNTSIQHIDLGNLKFVINVGDDFHFNTDFDDYNINGDSIRQLAHNFAIKVCGQHAIDIIEGLYIVEIINTSSSNRSYRASQFDRLGKSENITLQISGEDGKTKFLNISRTEMLAIRELLS